METTETVQQTPKRLFKSRQNRIIDGVCGGIAEYFDVDPTIVRVLWVLMTFLGGSGIILYIIAMIIMPVNPNPAVTSPESGKGPSDRKRYFGIVLILIGAFLLLANFGWLTDFPFWAFSGRFMLPVLFILAGALFIYVQTSRHSTAAPQGSASPGTEPAAPQVIRELRRSRTNKKIFGVCGGLAQYFNVDPTIVRVLFAVLILASLPWGLLLYILLGIILREEQLPITTS